MRAFSYLLTAILAGLLGLVIGLVVGSPDEGECIPAQLVQTTKAPASDGGTAASADTESSSPEADGDAGTAADLPDAEETGQAQQPTPGHKVQAPLD